jgi:hypothetical protein
LALIIIIDGGGGGIFKLLGWFAQDQRPESLESAVRVFVQRNPHMHGVSEQKVFVVPRALFPPLKDFGKAALSGPDILR